MGGGTGLKYQELTRKSLVCKQGSNCSCGQSQTDTFPSSVCLNGFDFPKIVPPLQTQTDEIGACVTVCRLNDHVNKQIGCCPFATGVVYIMCLPHVIKPAWCYQTQPVCVITTVILSVLLNHMSVHHVKHHGRRESRLGASVCVTQIVLFLPSKHKYTNAMIIPGCRNADALLFFFAIKRSNC